MLGVDGKTIGKLTGENYFRLDMWPGEYEFSIFLPRETFLGQVHAAANFSRQITLMNHASGSAYICSYTDGMGTSGFSLKPITIFPEELVNRELTRTLTARQTAQVTHLFGARYDGPAIRSRPHGKGTLKWPDGSVYRGVFMHGEPTRTARFFFPDGRIYMGPNYRGRPAGKGLLMSAEGDILFAGRITNERPDGRGLRMGKEGPEICRYEDGRDVTKTFQQLAREAIDREDAQRMLDVSTRTANITAEIDALNQRIKILTGRHDPDRLGAAIAQAQRQIDVLERKKHRDASDLAADKEALVKALKGSRRKRERAREMSIRQQHQTVIEKERQWCLDEFAQGRQLCICAPFVENAHQWQECWQPLRQRYVY